MILAVVCCFLLIGQSEAAPVLIADSVTDFAGVQGQNNWYYGYVQPATSSAFIQMPNYDGSWYIQSGAGGYWTILYPTGAHPNGISTSGSRQTIDHWAVRRWASETIGQITISGHLAKSGSGGNGIVGRILVDGVTLYSQYIGATDTTGVNYSIVATVSLTSKIDFVLDPYQSNDGADSTTFTAQIYGEMIPEPSTCVLLGLMMVTIFFRKGYARFK